jgi:hypothetical protein
MITVMSGLDPHMINQLEVEINLLHLIYHNDILLQL